jgi:hypothetical protein
MRTRELLLSRRVWRRLLTAFVVLAVIRAALWLLPFPSVQRLVRRLGRRSPRAREPLSLPLVEGRAVAIRLASRLVPRATCLTQALGLQVLLARSGTPSELRLGVAHGDGGALSAHAWLECQGRVVIGGRELERYSRLPALKKTPA